MGATLEKTIWIPKGKEYDGYETQNIYYCESNNQYTYFYIDTGDKKLTTVVSSKGIGEWEKELEEYGFCRIHSRFLVNIRYVKSVINNTKDGTITLKNGKQLCVSKTKKEKLLSDLGIK